MKSRVLLLTTMLAISMLPFISPPVAPYPISAGTAEQEEKPSSLCSAELSCSVWKDMGEVVIPLSGSEKSSNNARTLTNTFCNKGNAPIQLNMSLQASVSQSDEWLAERQSKTLAPDQCATLPVTFAPRSAGFKTAEMSIFRVAGNDIPIPTTISVSGTAVYEDDASVIQKTGVLSLSTEHTHMAISEDDKLLLGKGSKAEFYQTNGDGVQTQTMNPPLNPDSTLCSSEGDFLVEAGASSLNLLENGQLRGQVPPRAFEKAQTLHIGNDWIRLVQDCGEEKEGIIFGRVEMWADGEWKIVCRDFFGQNGAKVVCRELGYAFDNFNFLSSCPGTGDNFDDLVICNENKPNLMSCPLMGMRSVNMRRCTSNTGAVVSCRAAPLSHRPRLAMANCPTIEGMVTGRLDIYNHGHWGGLCDKGLSRQVAKTACADLGYPTENAQLLQSCQSENDTPPVLNLFECGGVECDGNEENLSDCHERCTRTCDGGESVHLACTSQPESLSSLPPTLPAQHPSSDVRLTPSNCYSDRLGFADGLLEILHEGKWETVSYDSFDINDAKVACRQMGYSGSEAWFRPSGGCGNAQNVNNGQRNPLLSKLGCTGRETSIQDCPKRCTGEMSARYSIQLMCRLPSPPDQPRNPEAKGCSHAEISTNVAALYLQNGNIFEHIWKKGYTRNIQSINSLVQRSPGKTMLMFSPDTHTLLLYDGANLRLFCRNSEKDFLHPSSSPLPVPLIALAGQPKSMTAYGLTEGEPPELIHITMAPNGSDLTAVRLGPLKVIQPHLMVVSGNNRVYVSNGHQVTFFHIKEDSWSSLPMISPAHP